MEELRDRGFQPHLACGPVALPAIFADALPLTVALTAAATIIAAIAVLTLRITRPHAL